ncbi:MAG: serine/threonine protein kinase [Phycisphaerae bacterium]|nr:serine/threonine protein kinase [Phycisphaerae bacterium]
MTPSLHQQAKELFLAVCEMDDSTRRAYLQARCGQDPALRAEVESLLQYHTTKTLLAASAAQDTQAVASTAGISTQSASDRWPSGTRVAERYRIISILGRGGMGEVYRAEDLRLSRTVALKFLTAGRGSDPAWLARFYAEARMASTITHRHVCRIYDIGEVDGEAFISMEYIDGENLATLLKRVGRLAPEKACHVARQLCLGLAAAHDRGILHRDLKPANVMLDERGEVRLTDFGIAVSVSDAATSERAGTLAYMAPEVRRGEPATIQSDVYSLGLILYELATGRPAAEPSTGGLPDASRVISPPSAWANDLDRKLERVILDCLEPDPRHRPESVYDVLGELPGGEVLAAMVASGETPPVHVVADSPRRPRRAAVAAIAGALFVAVGLIVALLLARSTLLISRARLSLPPEVLGQKAEEILRTLGYDPASYSCVQAFEVDHKRWNAIRGTTTQPAESTPSLPIGMEVLCYRYRLFGRSTESSQDFSVFETQPPGGHQVEVLLTGDGHLRWLDGWGSRKVRVGSRGDSPWATLFSLAGLQMSDFRLVSGDDRVRLWEPAQVGATSIRVRADLQEGRIRFNVGAHLSAEPTRATRSSEASGQTDRDDGDRTSGHQPPPVGGQTATSLIFIGTLIASMPLAWNNARRKTSDRRGASQIAIAVFGMQFVLYVLGHSVPESFVAAVVWFVSASQLALFTSFMVWIYYMAIEPYVRRFWPHSLISWTRVLAGRIRDPLVGHDIVLGAASGVAIFILQQLNAWVGLQSAHPWAALVGPVVDWEPGRLSGYQFTANSLVNAALLAMTRGLIVLALMLLLRLIFRQRWLAIVALIVLLAAALASSTGPIGLAPWLTCGLLAAGMAVTLQELGFLAFLTSLFVTRLLVLAPLTLDRHVWYASQSLLSVLVIAAAVAWALSMSLKRSESRFRSPTT